MTPPAPSHSAVPLVDGARLPLAFIGIGLVLYLVGSARVAVQPDLLLLPSLHPKVAAVTHLWLVGSLLAICLGVLYQLGPVLLGVALRSGLAGPRLHLGLHVVGATTLCAGFARGRFDQVGLGGALVAAGLAIFATALFRTFLASRRRDAVAWSLPLATGWLCLTVLLGIIMATHRLSPWLPVGAADLLRAHAHLGLAGFFLTLLQGATFQLVPMFTLGSPRRPRLILAGLVLGQIGLPVLALGLAFNRSAFAAVGGLLLAGALTCSGLAFRATWASRRRVRVEPGLRAFILGGMSLLLAGALGLTLLFGPLPDAWIKLYGLLIVGGGFALTILGMTLKITPFLVWMRAYGPWVGQRLVPATTSLASPLLERVWLFAHPLAVALLGLGVVTASPASLALGASLLALAALVFVANQARILRHLIKPASLLANAPPSS